MVTSCGHSWSTHGGASVHSITMARNRNKVRRNESHALAIMSRYEDLGGEAEKGVLIGGAYGEVEEDGIDEKACKV
jgi:hypothetical protein